MSPERRAKQPNGGHCRLLKGSECLALHIQAKFLINTSTVCYPIESKIT
jgi:hypothetical protein